MEATTATAATALFDRLTDEQLLSVTKHHVEKFNAAWQTVMATHHKTGRHIDASDTMDREYRVLGQLDRYIFNNRPAALHNRFVEVANWQA